MIKSCADCKTKCCKTGPGPYKKLAPLKYLENFGDVLAYNTKCEALTRNEKCRLWGTKKFPTECRVYVCQSKKYSTAELKQIKKISMDQGCPKCGVDYMLYHGWRGGGYHYSCENCGDDFRWIRDRNEKKI